MQAELSILDFIQANLRSPLLDTVMVFITSLGNGGIIWIVMGTVLLLIQKTRKMGATMVLGLALEVLCCNVVLKPLVARIRPCEVNTAVQLLVALPTDFSFPSGHTGASFAAVAALHGSRSRLWLPACVLAFLIAFSRLYLYVHYPTDVLAGILMGIITGCAGSAIVNYLWRRKHERTNSAL